MGIAIASGVPVAAGLMTGIVGGLVVGFLAGAPLQVSGPAAGLTVIVYELVQTHGLEVLGPAVLLGGTVQLIAGLLRYGRVFRAVSPAVIHGMLAGIGVLIFASQFHVMVDDAPKGSGIANLLSIPEAVRKGLPVPEPGTADERRARRWLLQQFGALHEQQVQLRELAAERIPATASSPDHGHDAHHSPPPALPDPQELKPLAVRQKQLTDHLAELMPQLQELLNSGSIRDAEEVRRAAELARRRLETARNHLEQGNVELVRESQAAAQTTLEHVLNRLKNHDWAAKIGLLTILTLVLWNFAVPRKLRLVPAPLAAVLAATIVAAVLNLPVLYVEVPDQLWSEIHVPSWSVLQSVPPMVIVRTGIVLAVVASAETLLCATAVDQMQSGSRTAYDRELAAQGIGNMICGFLGALPMTGVIVRSSANVEAGARTRLSTILHGLWLLIFVSFLSFLLRMIPTAALAGMLVYIGYRLVSLRAVQELRKYGRGEVAVYTVTLVTIVCTDLLTGVLTGIILSAVRLLHRFSRLRVELDIHPDRQQALLKLTGAATFIRLPALADALERVPPACELHVDFDRLTYIDHACLDLLMTWARQHETTGGTLVIDWESLHAHFRSRPVDPDRTSRPGAA